MTIIWLPTAEKHLDLIYRFIAQDSAQSANKWAEVVFRKIEQLKLFPYSAPREVILSKFPEDFRSLLVKKDYKIVYYVDKDIIYIVAVWNCRQNPANLTHMAT